MKKEDYYHADGKEFTQEQLDYSIALAEVVAIEEFPEFNVIVQVSKAIEVNGVEMIIDKLTAHLKTRPFDTLESMKGIYHEITRKYKTLSDLDPTNENVMNDWNAASTIYSSIFMAQL